MEVKELSATVLNMNFFDALTVDNEVVTSTEVVTVPDDRSDVPPSTDHSAQGEMPPAEQPRSPPAAAETATASQAKGGDALD